jgi:hypothetical protein
MIIVSDFQQTKYGECQAVKSSKMVSVEVLELPQKDEMRFDSRMLSM